MKWKNLLYLGSILYIDFINKKFEKNYSRNALENDTFDWAKCKEFWHECDWCLSNDDKTHYVGCEVCGPEMQFTIVFINETIHMKLTIDVD